MMKSKCNRSLNRTAFKFYLHLVLAVACGMGFFYQKVSLDGAKTPPKKHSSLFLWINTKKGLLSCALWFWMFTLVVFHLVILQRHSVVQIHMSSNAQQTYIKVIFWCSKRHISKVGKAVKGVLNSHGPFQIGHHLPKNWTGIIWFVLLLIFVCSCR